MQLAQFRYFTEICQNGGNMTRAAEKLHVSQPALSKAIRDLEAELEIPLFYRIRQRLELTPDGQYLLERVKDILQQVDEIPALLHRQRNSNLLLGIHPSLSYVMFDFLSGFSTVHPEITVLLSSSSNRRQLLIDNVYNGILDAVVVIYNPSKNHPSEDLYRTLDLTETQVVYVVNRNHPLAGRKKVSYADIVQYPIYGHTSSALRRIQSLGLTPKLVVSTHDLSVISRMSREQNSGSILVREFARAVPDSVILELEDGPKAVIALVSKREVPPAKIWVVKTLFDYMDNHKDQVSYLL